MNRVLIVDDEHLIRSSLSKKASEVDPTIVVSGTAANGQMALDWLESYYTDICITDVRMPKISGLELIEAINRQYPWMHCIVVSSYDDFNFVRQSLRQGAVDYILKPIEQSTLAAALLKASWKIQREREDRAVALMVQYLPHHRGLVDRWIELMKLGELSMLPLLVVETLETLEMWTGNRLDLLKSLSFAWLNVIKEELSKDEIDIRLEEGQDIGIGDKTIANEKLRFYFRLCAVRRLEEGAAAIYEACKASQDRPTRRTIQEAKQYIGENFAAKISLQQIADRVQMSKSYFANLFKQETGMTIWEYVTALRMYEARKLLLETPLKMYEIAQKVGFDNSVYFAHLFKEFYSLTPSEYKKRMES
jgi:two-component system response regulator YesN